MKSENFEMALDEIIWLITLLANQPSSSTTAQQEKPKDLLTEEEVELLTSPLNWRRISRQLPRRCSKGRLVTSKARMVNQKSRGRVSDDELFTRLLYYGTVHLNRSEEETWLPR
jgi:hypothetical protein